MHKVSFISFLAMCGVLVWHSGCGAPMQNWFIPIFAFWSVPWFFLCSGFFFIDSFDRHGFAGLLRGKIYSLLIPYVLWCALGALIMRAPFDELGIELFIQMFAIRGTHPAWNRALWFLRALIIFSLIGSIVLLCLGHLCAKQRMLRLVVYAVAFLVCVKLLGLCGLKFGPGSSSVYFVLGALLSSTLRGKDGLGRFIACHAGLFSWLLIVSSIVCRLVWFAFGFTYENSGGTLGHGLNNLSVILFILGLWYVGDKLLPSNDGWLMTLCSVSSFVYFSHQPLMDYVWRATQYLFGRTNDAFVINMVVAITVFPALALLLKRMPGYRILSGGR